MPAAFSASCCTKASGDSVPAAASESCITAFWPGSCAAIAARQRELVRALRNERASKVPIVMITTEGTMGKVEEAMDECAVNGYVIKPFTAEKGFSTSPFGIRLNALTGSKKRTGLNQKGFIQEIQRKNIPGQRWCQIQFAAVAASEICIYKK